MIERIFALPRLLWWIGFAALVGLSSMGAMTLFQPCVAIVLAIAICGLSSGLVTIFRQSRNWLALLAALPMIACASLMDGAAVWEQIKNRHLVASNVAEGRLTASREAMDESQTRVDRKREQIATLVRQVTNLDNDGISGNDSLIPGILAEIESAKSDLPNLVAATDKARETWIAATADADKATTLQQFLLTWAQEQKPDNPAIWIISWATLFFLAPECALAILAFSLPPVRCPEDQSVLNLADLRFETEQPGETPSCIIRIEDFLRKAPEACAEDVRKMCARTAQRLTRRSTAA